jgi:hypothetical protein
LTAGASLFAGGHFENLAAYLSQPYSPRAPNLMPKPNGSANTRTFDFVTLYDLDPNKERKPKHIHSIPDFEREVSPLIDNSQYGHMLFLRGHPSPEWLLSIGTKYQVDPEYFQRYLDFFLGQPEHFPLPSLPSTALPMIKLKITTVGGSQNPPKTLNHEEELQSVQSENLATKRAYREKLRTHADCSLGDSIVRDCSIHDLSHFSIEQDIYINTRPTRKSWVCKFSGPPPTSFY